MTTTCYATMTTYMCIAFRSYGASSHHPQPAALDDGIVVEAETGIELYDVCSINDLGSAEEDGALCCSWRMMMTMLMMLPKDIEK